MKQKLHKQALLCSIELGSIKCNLETAKIGILPWENMSTTIAKLPNQILHISEIFLFRVSLLLEIQSMQISFKSIRILVTIREKT